MNNHQFLLQEAEMTTAALLSAVDGLERIARTGPRYVKPCQPELLECSDRLAALVMKLLDRQAAE